MGAKAKDYRGKVSLQKGFEGSWRRHGNSVLGIGFIGVANNAPEVMLKQ